MHWNYRVFKEVKKGRKVYSVREVYYDENNKTVGWTDAGESIDNYDSPEDMLRAIRSMVRDIETSIDDVMDSDSKSENDDPGDPEILTPGS